MRAPLFFAVCLVLVVAMAAIALTPAFERTGAPQEATATSSVRGFALEPAQIGQIGSDGDVEVTAPPGISMALTGTAITATKPFDPATAKGARLVFGPETRAGLSGSSHIVVLKFAPLPNEGLEPAQIAVGFVVAGSPIQWVRKSLTLPLDADGPPIEIQLPAPDAAPLALAIWPSVSGEGRGFQITGLAINQSTPPASQP
jgi:hypothetical protein